MKIKITLVLTLIWLLIGCGHTGRDHPSHKDTDKGSSVPQIDNASTNINSNETIEVVNVSTDINSNETIGVGNVSTNTNIVRGGDSDIPFIGAPGHIYIALRHYLQVSGIDSCPSCQMIPHGSNSIISTSPLSSCINKTICAVGNITHTEFIDTVNQYLVYNNTSYHIPLFVNTSIFTLPLTIDNHIYGVHERLMIPSSFIDIANTSNIQLTNAVNFINAYNVPISYLFPWDAHMRKITSESVVRFKCVDISPFELPHLAAYSLSNYSEEEVDMGEFIAVKDESNKVMYYISLPPLVSLHGR